MMIGWARFEESPPEPSLSSTGLVCLPSLCCAPSRRDQIPRISAGCYKQKPHGLAASGNRLGDIERNVTSPKNVCMSVFPLTHIHSANSRHGHGAKAVSYGPTLAK